MDEFLKKARVKFSSAQEVEPHEILVDRLMRKKEQEGGAIESKLETPLLRKIVNRFFVFCILIVLALFLRTFQIQILEGEQFTAQAEANRYIISQLQAERGVIYDQHGKQLVFNVPSFDLVCDKSVLPQSEEERERVLREIGEIVDSSPSDLAEKIELEDNNSVVLAEDLPHQQLIILKTKMEELPGFKIQNRLKREYGEGEFFSHLMGYMGRISPEEIEKASSLYSIFDYVGRAGIEKSYEEILRKDPGQVRLERDAQGNIISQETVSLPQSGKSLVLWLDAGLQKKIYEELQNTLQNIGSKRAVGIALDPKTGGVLSMVSIPSFDNNVFSAGEKEPLETLFSAEHQPLFNRAMSGVGYPTGSTIKPLIAAAALEENIIQPERTINCSGLIEVPHQYEPDIIYQYHDWNVHGRTDMRKAIAESCNVYFYTLGGGYEDFGIDGLGSENIKKYLRLFGWGEKTGINLPNEGAGVLPETDKDWRRGNTYHLSIGQGPFSITPLQVANAFVSVANGGSLLEPQVVKGVVESSAENPTSTLRETSTKVIRRDFIAPENMKVVREGMRQAVTGKGSPLASATILNSLPVSSAAKTGTAETQKEGIYHNWVTVFAPYDDPEIVLTLMIEDVEGVRAAVLPPAKEILNWYFTN